MSVPTTELRQRRPVARLTFAERLNFLVTNRIPRRWLTLSMGRFSKVENPIVKALSIATWKLFADDLRLHEAKKTRFNSLHDCFVRELKAGTRPIDPDPLIISSPCDAVVGEYGAVRDFEAIQAKGFPYTINELLGDEENARRHRNSRFVTLRLKSSMYHRFHAPCDARLDEIHYISGDTWNVNPIALKSIERLFCKNERVVLNLHRGADDEVVTLVAVAAILVASIRIHGLDEALTIEYKGSSDIPCRRTLQKGEEIGYFEHGSTIVMFVPRSCRFADSVSSGKIIRTGEPLFQIASISDRDSLEIPT